MAIIRITQKRIDYLWKEYLGEGIVEVKNIADEIPVEDNWYKYDNVNVPFVDIDDDLAKQWEWDFRIWCREKFTVLIYKALNMRKQLN